MQPYHGENKLYFDEMIIMMMMMMMMVMMVMMMMMMMMMMMVMMMMMMKMISSLHYTNTVSWIVIVLHHCLQSVVHHYAQTNTNNVNKT